MYEYIYLNQFIYLLRQDHDLIWLLSFFMNFYEQSSESYDNNITLQINHFSTK